MNSLSGGKNQYRLVFVGPYGFCRNIAKLQVGDALGICFGLSVNQELFLCADTEVLEHSKNMVILDSIHAAMYCVCLVIKMLYYKCSISLGRLVPFFLITYSVSLFTLSFVVVIPTLRSSTFFFSF